MGNAEKQAGKNNRLLKAIIGLAVLAACLLVSRTLSFQLHSIQAYQISPSEVNFITVGEFGRVRRARANEIVQPFANQWLPAKTSARQFNYTFELDPEHNQNELALYLPSIGGTASVYINGMGLSNATTRKFSAPGFGRHTIFTKLPNTSFQPGVNRANIIVNSGRKSGLKHFYIGPSSVLETAILHHQNTINRHNTALLILGVLLTLSAGLVIFSGTQSRSEIGISLALSGLGILYVGQYYLFQNFGTAGHTQLYEVLELPFYGFKVLVLLWLIKRAAANMQQRNGFELGLLTFAICASIAGLMPLVRPNLDVQSWYAVLANIAIAPYCLYLAVYALSGAIRENKSNSTQMAVLVQEQKEALATKERELQEQLKHAAALEERQRITRDMHDGIGGQLLSLLVRVRGGTLGMTEIEQGIQDGINDLRLIVDSMDNSGDSLLTALTTFRMRTKAQLDAADITLTWQQTDEIHLPKTNTRSVLSIYRLLQEAVSNVVRHADAKTLRIEVSQDAPQSPLIIHIADDGKGVPDKQAVQAGKGMINMQTRAKTLGGTLVLGKGIGGEGFGLTLTLPAAPLAQGL